MIVKRSDWRQRQAAWKVVAEGLIDSGMLPTCINCEDWHEASEVCKLANSRPPATVIVKACDAWTEMIPF